MAIETSSSRLRVVEGGAEAHAGGAPEKLWGVPEVCAFLRMKKTWVYDQVAANVKGGLPFRRIGGRLRFLPDEVRAWAQRPVTAPPKAKKGKG